MNENVVGSDTFPQFLLRSALHQSRALCDRNESFVPASPAFDKHLRLLENSNLPYDFCPPQIAFWPMVRRRSRKASLIRQKSFFSSSRACSMLNDVTERLPACTRCHVRCSRSWRYMRSHPEAGITTAIQCNRSDIKLPEIRPPTNVRNFATSLS